MDKSNQVTLRRFLVILVAILSIPLLFNQLFIRHVYTQWLEPESTAGTIMMASSVVQQQLDTTKKNILILGNSRVAEGFSAKLANSSINNNEYHFVSLALPGTTARIWSYVLRKIDKDRNLFFAVYLMAENYNDTAEENYSDRDVDTAYLAAILTLSDLRTYPSSFDNHKKKVAAFKNILFPIAPLHKDVIQFIQNPFKRVERVLLWRKDYVNWSADYPGRDERLPELTSADKFDSVLQQLAGPRKSEIEWYFQAVKKCNKEYPHSYKYNSLWFGDIERYYAGSSARLGVFMIPRGPYHQLMGCDASLRGTLGALHNKGVVEVVSSKVSTELEQPEYFFDHLHINATGRKVFSVTLANAIVAQLDN